MKFSKHLVVIIVALALGGAATFMSYRLIQSEVAERTGNKVEKKVGVVVANQDLEAGTILTTSLLSVREIPEAYITSDSLMPEAVGQVESGRLLRPVKGGEQLLMSAVSRVDNQSFSSTLKTGTRALTFSVDEVNSLSGLLTPDDHIDLLLVYKKGEQDVSLPLLENIRVLATGQKLKSNQGSAEEQSQAANNSYTNITLEVTTLDARKLTLAQSAGARITAVLRSTKDEMPLVKRAASLNELLAYGESTPPKRAAGSSYGIPVYVGGMGDLKPSLTRVANPTSLPNPAAMQQLVSLLQKEQKDQQPVLSSPSPKN